MFNYNNMTKRASESTESKSINNNVPIIKIIDKSKDTPKKKIKYLQSYLDEKAAREKSNNNN